MIRAVLAFLVALLGVVRDGLSAAQRKQERQAGEDHTVRTALEAENARVNAAKTAEQAAMDAFDAAERQRLSDSGADGV